MPVTVDTAGTVAALDDIAARVEEIMPDLVAGVAHIIQGAVMGNAPVGTTGNSTNMPGDLRRSVQVDGPTPTGDGWEARVGPTTIYGRQRELGGDIYPHSSRALRFEVFGRPVLSRHVYQHPNPYTKTGYEEAREAVRVFVYEEIADATDAT